MKIDSLHSQIFKKNVYLLTGKDYLKFFNNITTNKIEMNNDRNEVRTLWLNNKGRIIHDISLLWDIDKSKENYEKTYLVENISFENLEENINKYKLSMDIEINKTKLLYSTVSECKNENKSFTEFYPNKNKILINESEKLFEMNKSNLENYIINGNPISINAFKNKTPMELNLWSLIDFKKGCYLGQEIVARVRYRGQVKRNFAYIKINSSISNIENLKILKNNEEIGEVVALEYSDKNNLYFSSFINHEENKEQKAYLMSEDKKIECKILKNNFKELNEKSLT